MDNSDVDISVQETITATPIRGPKNSPYKTESTAASASSVSSHIDPIDISHPCQPSPIAPSAPNARYDSSDIAQFVRELTSSSLHDDTAAATSTGDDSIAWQPSTARTDVAHDHIAPTSIVSATSITAPSIQ